MDKPQDQLSLSTPRDPSADGQQNEDSARMVKDFLSSPASFSASAFGAPNRYKGANRRHDFQQAERDYDRQALENMSDRQFTAEHNHADGINRLFGDGS
jgi:hypothetical protein